MNIIFYDNVMLFWAGGDFLYQGPFSVSGSNLTLYGGRKICPFTLSGDSLTLREFDDNIPTLVFQKKQAD
jgi:hypothetical protein